MRRSRSSAARHAVLAALASTVANAACRAPPARPVAASCPTDHPVVLASQSDIVRVGGCSMLPGVIVRSGAALDTSVLRAATIKGDLAIGPTVGVREITFRELRVVEGAIRVSSNGLLQGLFLPRLESAGRIEIDGNVAATTISLPRLVTVRGALRVTDNASLELIDIPMLQSIDEDLVLSGVPQLTLLDASELTRAASIQIAAPKLPPELVDRLRAAFSETQSTRTEEPRPR